MGSHANFPSNFKANPTTSAQQKAGQMDTGGVEPLKTTTETRNTDSVQKLVREIAAGTPLCNLSLF